MFGKYPGAYLHRIANDKFQKAKDWLDPHNEQNKVPQNLENKLTVTFFKGLFKLANIPGWRLFLGQLIPLRGCEKRGCKKILNSKISFCLFSTIQNCSTTIGGSGYFKIVIIISFAFF